MTKIDFKLNGKSVKQTSIQYKQHLTKFKEIVNILHKSIHKADNGYTLKDFQLLTDFN